MLTLFNLGNRFGFSCWRRIFKSLISIYDMQKNVYFSIIQIVSKTPINIYALWARDLMQFATFKCFRRNTVASHVLAFSLLFCIYMIAQDMKCILLFHAAQCKQTQHSNNRIYFIFLKWIYLRAVVNRGGKSRNAPQRMHRIKKCRKNAT